MNLKKAASAVSEAFKQSNVQPSESGNTHVVLASQAESAAPEPQPDHGERDGNGKLPESNALVSDRSRVLREIAERRNAQANAEAGESLPATDENGEEMESAPPAPEEDGPDLDAAPQESSPSAPSDAPAQPAPAVAAPAPEETRTLVIDGRTVQVPISKLVETGTRALQKELAADVRLNQATQILEEAKRVAAQQPAQPAAPAEPSLADKSDEELAELIQFGTREQATQAIKLLRRSSAPQVKPEEIVRAAQQAVAPAIAFEEGKKYAKSEYGDLLADPDLGAIFLNRENALRASGDQRGYIELYKAIGDDLRVKFNRPKPGAAGLPPAQQPSTTTRTMEEKRQAKAAAPAAPRLASQRLDGEGALPKPPTREQIFDRMRAARGFKRHSEHNLN